VEDSGRLLTKEELMKRVWPDTVVEEANLSHNIYKLREALAEADVVVVTEVYAAREEPIPGVSGRQVAEAAERAGADTIFEADRLAVGRRVLALLRPGDVVLTLGAGDITRGGRELVQWLQAA